jgi:hypothetical protein
MAYAQRAGVKPALFFRAKTYREEKGESRQGKKQAETTELKPL